MLWEAAGYLAGPGFRVVAANATRDEVDPP